MVKHSLVYSYYGIQIHNTEEQSIDIHNYLDEFPKNYVTLKNARPQKLCSIWFHLYNIIEMIKLEMENRLVVVRG